VLTGCGVTLLVRYQAGWFRLFNQRNHPAAAAMAPGVAPHDAAAVPPEPRQQPQNNDDDAPVQAGDDDDAQVIIATNSSLIFASHVSLVHFLHLF